MGQVVDEIKAEPQQGLCLLVESTKTRTEELCGLLDVVGV